MKARRKKAKDVSLRKRPRPSKYDALRDEVQKLRKGQCVITPIPRHEDVDDYRDRIYAAIRPHFPNRKFKYNVDESWTNVVITRKE